MIFPYCRKPYSDELWYGYIYDMFRKCGYKNLLDVEEVLGAHIRICYPSNIARVCDRVENKFFPDMMQAIRMTALGVRMDGLSEGEAAKTAEIFLQIEGSQAVPGRGMQEPDEIHICPLCWAEDQKNFGEGYLHLSHHLPGAKVCARHGVALLASPAPPKPKLLRSFECNTVLEVQDLKHGAAVTRQLGWKNEANLGVLVWSRCERCGKAYVEHPYSRKTACGCPYCNEKVSPQEILARRLYARFGGEYQVEQEPASIHKAVVVHTPCGKRTQKLPQLLYGDPGACSECKRLTSKRLQRRFDPEKKAWVFLDFSEEDRARSRIHVRHLVCGQEYYIFMSKFTSKAGGYCPRCDNPQQQIDIRDVDDEYEIIGEYKNNREPVEMRHKPCGTRFFMSKTSFLAGSRCPVCTPRYSFDDVEEAIKTCAPGWGVRKLNRRGMAQLITPQRFVLSPMEYSMIMADLKREKPSIIQDRVQQYKDRISIRKQIYDEICRATEQKGFWTFADGLNGQEVTRIQRNLVQDLCRLGFTERVGVGMYRPRKEDDQP